MDFVELKEAFEEQQQNADRMAMYRPTKAHREAFERICQGVSNPNDKKFYLLSGSYGTGKSHLCLMTANFLSKSSGDPEISEFYENYAKLDPEKAKLLKNVRRDGQYLVAICDYDSGRSFEDEVLKAVAEACEARGLDIGVQTQYDEGARQLEYWKEAGDSGGIRNFYEDFGATLESEHPGYSVETLLEDLAQYDSDALVKFRDIFRKIMGGIEFQAQSGNLVPIIKNLIKSDAFKERFKGLAIFYDEFGFTLEDANYSKGVLQGFMEKICQNEPNVLFVGCIHKNFKDYADRLSKDDAAVMSARVTQVDLRNDGIEEIIGALVETDKQNKVWKEEVEPRTGIFDRLLPTCESLNLFPWIKNVNRVRAKVLEDIYGMHPAALSCLLTLSSEIGSDARSTFSFFTGAGAEEDVGGYKAFIENEDVLLPNDKINLYTVDRLVNFFKNELSPKNSELRDRQRKFVNGCSVALDQLRKTSRQKQLGFFEDKRKRILSAILIYQLCGIPTTLENIQFGLYCLDKSEQKGIRDALKELSKNGVVYLRKQSNTYELPEGGGEDPYDYIDRYLGNTELHPDDLVAAFLKEGAGKDLPDYVEAKQYNLPFNEDKRFKPYFFRARDIGDHLLEEIRNKHESNANNPTKSYEGSLIYVLCEEDSDITVARKAVGDIKDNNIALAIPHKPQLFTETLLRVKACRYYLPPNEPEKISAQTESRFRDILENADDGYLTRLKRTYEEIIEGGNACWYWRGGKVLVDRPKQSHKPADMICDELYRRRCQIKHTELNLVHDDKWAKGKNTSLKQAVGVLLDADRVMIDNGNPDSHGEKRYLENVLLRGAGALRKIDSDGPVAYFRCETDSGKIHDDYPVLKELNKRLNKLEENEAFDLGTFLAEAKGSPFGAGGNSLVLALAHIVRGYDERLIVYKDSTRMVEQSLTSYDDIAELVAEPAPTTVLGIRDISDEQYQLLDAIAESVGAPPLRHGEDRSLNETFEALRTWWEKLPQVSKVLGIYNESAKRRMDVLKDLMNNMAVGTDRFDFLLNQFPAVYNLNKSGEKLLENDVQVIAQKFAEDVNLFNSGLQIARDMLAESLCGVYGVDGGDMVECEKVIREWFEGLSPGQRSIQRCDNEEAKQFIKHLNDPAAGTSEIITKRLAKDYGFGPLSQWTSLHIKDYTAKIKHAKQEIDKAKPIVKKPDINQRVYEIQGSKIPVAVPEGACRLIYTLDETDPKDSETACSVDSSIELSHLIEDRPVVKIKMRAVDEGGHYSDIVQTELVDKSRKYELQEISDLFGLKEAKFNCPEDTEGFMSVLESILEYGLENQFIDRDAFVKIMDFLSAIIGEKKDGH